MLMTAICNCWPVRRKKRTETYLNRKLYVPDETIPDSDPDGLHLPDDIRLGMLMLISHFLRKPLVGYGSGETRHAAEFWLACRPVQVLSAMKNSSGADQRNLHSAGPR